MSGVRDGVGDGGQQSGMSYEADVGGMYDTEGANLGVFGAFIVALVAAIVSTLLWAGELRRVSAASKGVWPTTQATVTASMPSTTVRGQKVTPVVDISYTVGGAKFEQFAMELDPAPRTGSTVTVWYDPADPSRATLTATWTREHNVSLWVIIGTWGVAAALTPVLVYRFRKASQGILIGADGT